MTVVHSVPLPATLTVDLLITEMHETTASVSGALQNVCHVHVDRSLTETRNVASTTIREENAQNNKHEEPKRF